jgi:FAD:protein FMN transferase
MVAIAETPGRPAALSEAAATGFVRVDHASRAMGGGLGIHLTVRDGDEQRAASDAARVADRVRAWAGRLTRHDPASELMRLNRTIAATVEVGPTLAACLAWGREATALTGGVVDPTLLLERLAAEFGATPGAAPGARPWRLSPRARGAAIIERDPSTQCDLDGVAKGWIADRALRLLDRHPGALVDADGDVAIRVAPGDAVGIGIADPRDPDMVLAILRLDDVVAGPAGRVGVATSGTSIHAWPSGHGEPGHRGEPARHHLIDPRTGRPAVTDVVQATVIAGSAAVAEAWAKTAVILGGATALETLDRARVRGAILLLADGRTVALPRTTRYLE